MYEFPKNAPIQKNWARWGISLLCLIIVGCAGSFTPPPPGGTVPIAVAQNPVFFAGVDREVLWNQLVDELDDYFRIEREERVRVIGDVATEGRIDTFPTIGATLFEPWRRDSTPGFERIQSTLQTIRRRAVARVIPSEGGYMVSIEVLKELEDLNRPEFASVATGAIRHDGSVAADDDVTTPEGAVTLGWISLGRDTQLEQRMLTNLQARLSAP